MSSTYRPIAPIATQRNVFPAPITALAFDPVSDILWAGNNTGGVSAYYGVQGSRGVMFPVDRRHPVKKIVAGDNYVRAVGTSTGIGTWTKGGMNKWYSRLPSNITTFCNNISNSPYVVASTEESTLVLLNNSTGATVRRLQLPTLATDLAISHSLLFSGSADGVIRSYDLRRHSEDGVAESSVKSHVAGIQGLEISGNYIFAIGWGNRQSRLFPDPHVKIFDLRNMRALPPIPFSAGPAFISVLPKRTSTVVITSNTGLINIVDISNPNRNEFIQLDVPTFVNSVAVSPTGAYLAFGDTEGNIHLLTSADERESLPFNGFDGQPIIWADPPEVPAKMPWADTTPLNAVGMPYYNTMLFSSWTSQFLPSGAYYPPDPKIPSPVLANMKINDFVGYATLPKELRGKRNVVVVPKKDARRFKSGKNRSADQIEPETPITDISAEKIPRSYRRVEIEYSKFGVEDFDFGFYNRTEYSGLETHIANCYTNALVQTMHYTTSIRRLAKSHITTNCPNEHCLLCELGFVMRMLEDAGGTNCQASNFCQTLGTLAQASNSISLIDFGQQDADYATMIQTFHRFLLDHLSSEGNMFPHNPLLLPSANVTTRSTQAAAPITQLLGIDAKNVIVCTNCKAVREKENMTHIVDLIYPRRVPVNASSTPDFASILRSSIIREMTHKATCQSCKQFSTFNTRRVIPTKDLPPVLAINTSVYNEENVRHWLRNGFLQPSAEVRGQIDGIDDLECAEYEVRSLIVQVVTKEGSSHLVSIIRMPNSELKPETTSPWFIFNDFVVTNVSQDEALSFPGRWKLPAIVYLERVDTRDSLDFSQFPDRVDPTILCEDISLSPNRDKALIQHQLLSREELPKPGMLIAIDAEFVSMQQEETEIRSNGTKRVIRPARLSLARVSVLRGDGPQTGVPFIDDHIHTSEVIVDYLTEFSGINYGDLEPQTSRHTLVPLKTAYKKLRLLVDLGCIFIGHGLSKDFRIINLYVPPEQVLDTVDMYYIRARQRRLSLRFLSWFVLHENIQQVTHDSIEDARTALMLYKAFQKFEEEGTLDQKLDEIYREGKQYNYKPPAPLASIISAATQPNDHVPSMSIPVVAPHAAIPQLFNPVMYMPNHPAMAVLNLYGQPQPPDQNQQWNIFGQGRL